MKENLGTGHEKKDTQVPGFVLGHRQIIMPQNQLQIMENRKHIDFEATKSNPVFNVKTPDYVRYPSSHYRAHLPGGAIKPGFESPLEIFWQRL